MKQEQFDKLIKEQLKTIQDTLINKQKEYATDDRLHNFRTAAILQNGTMEQALGGMLCKHTVSIYDMIASDKRYSVEKWDEKINDHIVYLLLLRAIVEEKKTHEYTIEFDDGPLMVKNPTYSEFVIPKENPWPKFLKENPSLMK